MARQGCSPLPTLSHVALLLLCLPSIAPGFYNSFRMTSRIIFAGINTYSVTKSANTQGYMAADLLMAREGRQNQKQRWMEPCWKAEGFLVSWANGEPVGS